MKKFLSICLIIIILGGFIRFNYISNKCKDINYAVEHYFTSGTFNRYKLYSIGNLNLSFSNGNIAVVKIDGMEKKSPHRHVAYSVFLEKNSQGIWKVKKIYSAQVMLRNRYIIYSYFFTLSVHSSQIPSNLKSNSLSINVNPVLSFIKSLTCCIGQSISISLWHSLHSRICL